MIKFCAATALVTSMLPAQTRAVMLLDRSGSMTITTSDGSTRCAKSAAQAKADIDNFFSLFGGTHVRVRQFSGVGGGIKDLGSSTWYTTAASAKAAVNLATTCTGSTPLADAICDTVNSVIAVPATYRYFYLYSDGGNNSSVGPCSGSNATNWSNGKCPLDFVLDPTVLPYTPAASWQAKACSVIESTGTVMNVYGFYDSSTDAPKLPFLRSIARASGGLFVDVRDSLKGIPGTAFAPSILGACRGLNKVQPVLNVVGVPRPGGTVFVGVQTARNQGNYLVIGFGLYKTPLNLTGLGARGCSIYVQPHLVLTGRPMYPIRLPANPNIIGGKVQFQGMSGPNAKNNPLGLVTTNFMTMQVQR